MKKIIVVILTVLIVFVFSSSVLAEDDGVKYPDVNYSDGEITLTVKNVDDGLIEGISLSIYKVADVVNDNNDLSYSKSSDFEYFSESVDYHTFERWLKDLDNSYSNDFAILLTNFVNSHSLTPIETCISDQSGRIKFDNLTLGIYLVVDNNANSKYYPISSFLISVPSKNEDTGLYNYKVNGNPKMEKLHPTPPPPVDPPEDPEKYIPNTSLPWFDVTIYGLAGIGFVLTGIYMIKRGRNA